MYWFSFLAQLSFANIAVVKAHSHCATCDCYLFLLVMGCTGAGEVVTVAWFEHFD